MQPATSHLRPQGEAEGPLVPHLTAPRTRSTAPGAKAALRHQREAAVSAAVTLGLHLPQVPLRAPAGPAPR